MQENHDTATELTIESILSRLDAIMADTKYIHEVLEATPHLGRDIGQVVKAREETNQRVIDLLTRMYEDLVGDRLSEKAREYRDIVRSIPGYPSKEFALGLYERVYGAERA